MRRSIFMVFLLFCFRAYSMNELEEMSPEQSKAMQACMLQYNDLHTCYKQSVGTEKNCFMNLKTGQTVCETSTNKRTGTEIEDEHTNGNRSHVAPKSPCSMAFYTANSKCNGNSLAESPQVSGLLNSMQANRNAGNIKEACAAAQNLNSISWSMNTTFGLQCQSAVRNCLTACDAGSDERDTCKTLEQNVKLAQNQSIENAKAYAQSGECMNIASGCGSNSYDNPNCPQYCQKPGRQNDSLCATQKSITQNQIQPINSKITDIQNPQSINVGTIPSTAPEKYPEFDNSKNDFIAQDESSQGPSKAVSINTPGNASTGSYTAGSPAPSLVASNQEKSKESSDKAITVAGSVDNSSNGGGSSGTGFIQSNPRGYPDASETGEEKKWYDLTRFLPMSEEEKIDRNMRAYNRKLLASSQRNEGTRHLIESSNFKRAKTQNQIEEIREPASQKPTHNNTLKNRIMIILILLTLLALSSSLFLNKKA